MSASIAWTWGMVVGMWLSSGYIAYCFDNKLRQTPRSLAVYAVVTAVAMVGGAMAIEALEGR